MSLPAVSFLAFAALERPYPPLECRPKQVEAVVILGGYISAPAGAQGYCVLGADTLSRCLHRAPAISSGRTVLGNCVRGAGSIRIKPASPLPLR